MRTAGKTVAASATAAIILASFTATAAAASEGDYRLTGCSWSSRTITWGGGGWSDSWEDILREAAWGWEVASKNQDNDIDMIRLGAIGPPRIMVHVEDYGDQKWAGRAPLFDQCDAGYYSDRADVQHYIQINTHEHQYATREEKLSTAAHEFGHTLGLAHPHTQTEDTTCADGVVLMSHFWDPRSECGVYEPQIGDELGLKDAYSHVPYSFAGVHSGQLDGATSGDDAPDRFIMDYTVHFDSLETVAEHSEVRAVIKPTGKSRIEYVGGDSQLGIEPTPFTVSEALVVNSSSDEYPTGETIEIRQVGTADEYTVNAAGTLETGKNYLAYLKPWKTMSDDDTGQHVIVGEQAIWELDQSNARRTDGSAGEEARRVADQSDLPKSVSVHVAENGSLDVTPGD